MASKICVHCGTQFHAPTNTKRCDNCRFITFPCEACGREKTIRRTRYDALLPDGSPKSHHFCSRKCSIGYGSRIAAKLRENKVSVICPNCGKSNERRISHAKRLFCDVNCYAEYRRNHPELYPANKPGPEAMKRFRQRTGKNNPMYGTTGDKSPFWKGGRTKYRGKGWGTINKLIKRRDGYRCTLCQKSHEEVPQLDIHHIFNWAETQCNHPHNLLTVCIFCHQGCLHGNQPSPPNHQLASLARAATLARLAPDDLRLIVSLDLQHRHGKGFPWCVVETLGLPESYLGGWQQLPLFELRLSAS